MEVLLVPRVRVDEEVCTGHGRCYVLAPEVYSADDMGHCCVENPEVPDAQLEAARRGEASCPEGAITVEP